MSPIIEAAINSSSPSENEPIEEIIEFGRKALRERRSDELARDLLALGECGCR